MSVEQAVLGRRGLLGLGGAAGAAVLVGVPAQIARADSAVAEFEDLGPGVVGYASLGSALVGQTMCVGSRNLSPSRIACYHVPTGEVTSIILGTGNFAEGIAAASDTVAWVGLTEAADVDNLYRCDLTTGQVEGVNIPEVYIRDVAVAPDGVVHVVGLPRPHGNGPRIDWYDPATGQRGVLAVPRSDADQGYAVDVNDTTVFYGCSSTQTALTGSGFYTVDRATGTVELIREGDIVNHGIAVMGDVVGAGGRDGWYGFLDLADGQWHEFALNFGRPIGRRGDQLLVMSASTIWAIDRSTWELTSLWAGVRGGHNALLGDTVVVATDQGRIHTYDLVTRTTTQGDVLAASDPMAAMAVGVGGGHAYVAGTGEIAVHDLSESSTISFQVYGEAKDMTWSGSAMYLGNYNDGVLLEHVPGTATAPRRVATFPSGQTRPWAVRWDPNHELVLVGTRNDSSGGGALAIYDPSSGELAGHVNPLGVQYIQAVAAGHGLVYFGGGTAATDLAAWDPTTGAEVWRTSLDLGRPKTLVTWGSQLWGMTMEGTLFVLDLSASTPDLIHHSDLSDYVTRDYVELVVDRGMVYGASDTVLFRIDPYDFASQILRTLNGDWFSSGSRLAVDEDHWIYSLQGKNLIRYRDVITSLEAESVVRALAGQRAISRSEATQLTTQLRRISRGAAVDAATTMFAQLADSLSNPWAREQLVGVAEAL